MNLYTSASEQTDILYIHTEKHAYHNILVFPRRYRAAHDIYSLHCTGLVKHIIQQLLFVKYNLCASNVLSEAVTSRLLASCARTLQKHLARVANNKNDGFSNTHNNDNKNDFFVHLPEETPAHQRYELHLKYAYSHTDQLNCALRHHAVQCQHAPIIL